VLAEVSVRALNIAPSRWAQHRQLEAEDKRLGLDLYPTIPADRSCSIPATRACASIS
jgi:hypothetical protein